ncbi:MMPL family transporter, partial [Conexibacter sp. JD483]|uniref:MMPL family transporter n=3 Tax=Conexibacter TaxID=191494 RepID=UPI00286FC68C
MRAALERVARAAAGHPLVVLLVAGALALGGGALALGLQPSTSTDSLASRSSAAGGATADYHEDFGDDAIFVLVREKLTQLTLTDDLGRLVQLEGCLSGNVPSGQQPYGSANSACAKLAELKPARVVYGPGTFLNQSANTIQQAVYARLGAAATQAARERTAAIAAARRAGKSVAEQQAAGRAAETRAQQEALRALQQLALDSGLKGSPSIDNRAFVSQIVFDPALGADQPKSRFAYLFPNADSALIQVRLRDDLSEQERARAIALVRAATEMPLFRLRHGGSYVVSGVPVVIDGLANTLTGELTLLLGAAVAAMALVLLLVFRARLRLLPLVLALAAAGLTFGLMRLAGVQLTMASIAVLPVLIGLAVDYAIQFQSRVEEQRAAGQHGAAAVGLAARAGAPTIATAALATATGFLVLLLSPVPMVRGFGLLLVVGIALAFAVTLTAGAAALALANRAPRAADAATRPRSRFRRLATVARPFAVLGTAIAAGARRIGGAIAASAAGARELFAGAGRALARPRPVAAL